MSIERMCPVCGQIYTDEPALSRVDNTTLICPECGIRQALESINVTDIDEQNHIIGKARDFDEANNARKNI